MQPIPSQSMMDYLAAQSQPKCFEPDEGDQCFGPDFPPELYYNAYALRTSGLATPECEYGYVGGQPLLAPDQKWPVCDTHGPLTFLWNFRETPDNWLAFFMCVDHEHQNGDDWIWPEQKCSASYGSGVHTCHAYVYYFAYSFLRTPLATPNLSSRANPNPIRELERKSLFIRPVKLVRPDFTFEQKSDYYQVGDKYIHSDVMHDETSRAESAAWQDTAFLFKTKGVIEQHEIPRGYGYLVMGSNSDVLPIWTLPNPGILNASKGLFLHHEL
jgi:hypothetical protein